MKPKLANSINLALLASLSSWYPVVGHFRCVPSIPSVTLYLPLLVFLVLNSLIPNLEKNPLIYVLFPIKKPQRLLANVLKNRLFPHEFVLFVLNCVVTETCSSLVHGSWHVPSPNAHCKVVPHPLSPHSMGD